ncbi:hypothetical protein B0H63DRAFT_458435 [Podospora didyma]|uniref:Nucleoside phosphorylase domain-containing protein n=1 Tax=Podospora didyma TaxID=330526 RepID=A0AAE0P583_9PEZI|nr:hypothetical protein B0H63DRAFT_458435 [Podospora didyma]
MIANHNVVLVRIGRMGTGPATSAAEHCYSSFPNIRLALVVGVWGGIPFVKGESQEILLGDVVISDSLVHYDYARQLPNGQFIQKDSAYKPKSEVASFLAMLKTRRGSKSLSDSMEGHLGKLQKKLGCSSAYPGILEDRLFESSYRHKHHMPAECSICNGNNNGGASVCEKALLSTCEDLSCDSGKLITRSRQTENAISSSYLPVVHFGPVGSGTKS